MCCHHIEEVANPGARVWTFAVEQVNGVRPGFVLGHQNGQFTGLDRACDLVGEGAGDPKVAACGR